MEYNQKILDGRYIVFCMPAVIASLYIKNRNVKNGEPSSVKIRSFGATNSQSFIVEAQNAYMYLNVEMEQNGVFDVMRVGEFEKFDLKMVVP